jgi:hypothetical protein
LVDLRNPKSFYRFFFELNCAFNNQKPCLDRAFKYLNAEKRKPQWLEELRNIRKFNHHKIAQLVEIFNKNQREI